VRIFKAQRSCSDPARLLVLGHGRDGFARRIVAEKPQLVATDDESTRDNAAEPTLTGRELGRTCLDGLEDRPIARPLTDVTSELLGFPHKEDEVVKRTSKAGETWREMSPAAAANDDDDDDDDKSTTLPHRREFIQVFYTLRDQSTSLAATRQEFLILVIKPLFISFQKGRGQSHVTYISRNPTYLRSGRKHAFEI